MDAGSRVFDIIGIIIVCVLFGGAILCTLVPDLLEQWRNKPKKG